MQGQVDVGALQDCQDPPRQQCINNGAAHAVIHFWTFLDLQRRPLGGDRHCHSVVEEAGGARQKPPFAGVWGWEPKSEVTCNILTYFVVVQWYHCPGGCLFHRFLRAGKPSHIALFAPLVQQPAGGQQARPLCTVRRSTCL